MKKLEDYNGTSYNFYPYMTKEGDYTFKVRTVPHTDEQKRYGKKSEWTESDSKYIDEDEVSDGSGQDNSSDGSSGGGITPGGGTTDVGWRQENNVWYFKYPDGNYIKNNWLLWNSKWYLFDNNGKMLTGWQQKDGLDTVLPYGLRKIQALRTLTTESTAVLIPFRAQEIMQPNGLYYGQNAVSKNMIVADRRLLLNGNSFRLGVSGSGKSMSAKEEIVQIALSTEDDILILDPESEFGYLTEALGGEVIRISATSDTHINALDMDRAYGDERNPIVSKSEFVLSLFEQLIGDGMVTAKEKSILGRCTEQVYLPYIRNGYKGTPPTLQDFYRLLQMQPEPEAQGLALSSELFITGTLNTFARHTNVDTQARIIAYDIRELGEQLMPLGMLVTLDAIYNRVIQNWKKGRRTWIFCDEFYILFRYEYSANFFYKLWKRIRKYNGLVTGLTQNVDELLRSDTARLMLANSEFLVMLNQSATDRAELAKLLNISDNQLGYVTNVPAGCGLIRCAGNIVPFTNSFPKDTKLYKLMSTNPSEKRE